MAEHELNCKSVVTEGPQGSVCADIVVEQHGTKHKSELREGLHVSVFIFLNND